MSRLKKCFSNWLHSAQPRKCPHCDHQAEENEMLEHLNYCQSMTYRKETSDGSVETIVEQTTSQPTNKTFNNNVNECKSIPRFVESRPTEHAPIFENNFHLNTSPTVRGNKKKDTASAKRKAGVYVKSSSCQCCGDLNDMSNIMRHAEKCQKLQSTFHSPNGTTISMDYAGPDENLIKRLQQNKTNNSSKNFE